MTAKSAKSSKDTSRLGGVDALVAVFRMRGAPEDLASYDASVLKSAAEQAFAALKRHKPGECIISIEDGPKFVHDGKPLSVITVVNDNMPFLFDSVSGEIAEHTGEPTLVLHPVMDVRHDGTGVCEIHDDGQSHAAGKDWPRVSLIHIHVPKLAEAVKEKLRERLEIVLWQVRRSVTDWKPMLARLYQAIENFSRPGLPLAKPALDEAVAFLRWLRDDNFIFLGMREFIYAGGTRDGALEPSGKEGLGILADPNVRVLRREDEGLTTTPEIRAFLHGPDPLIVTKANAKSVVHRRIYLDYIGVKTFDAEGRLAGELRMVGLFTSTAYTRSVMQIPYLRSKAKAVMDASGFDPHDHSGKALISVLESFPRDELFQIETPLLQAHAHAILALGERPRVRVLFRVDRFDRFVSVIVFVPRDRYDSDAREKIGQLLKDRFDGRVSAYYPAFPEGSLVRVHFIIGRSGGRTPEVDAKDLEAEVRRIVRTWDDALRDAVGSDADPALLKLANRLPQSYRNAFTPYTALQDAQVLGTIGPEHPIAIDFYRDTGQGAKEASLKIYHYGEPVELSKRVPILENMGFRVISERTFEIGGDGRIFIHDMELANARDREVDLSDEGELLEEVFLSIWDGQSDNDEFAELVQTARLRARQIQLLRVYGRYLQQAGIPQSQGYIAGVLNRYPDIARGLFQLFEAKFDSAVSDGEVVAMHLKAAIKDALDDVPQIDDDTIIRRLQNLIEASLRTNYYLEGEAGPRSLAIKFDSRAIIGLPEPRPWREVFVYGPEVEGVHLRFGPVARGGLRWSDRAQDYRTEVLGLVKAQQVKNAVIVPVGAKGGFYPRRLPARGSRAEVFEAGRSAYINFISTLISITDNIENGRVVPPKTLVRHDGDDAYFVVAADKGTATFSDTANAISQEHGFWLDDAFASGGSAGYDHKKMGITARGAWEAVKRHFREMNRDIQTEPFTVAGVGDMSGDVFGNGMLLSSCIRLVAAFDHRDIFIDPDPDPEATYAERRRLFENPQLSWQDFDRKKLSKGGMIVSRALKTVSLTKQAAEAIGLAKTDATPTEIMNAILKAPVDLLWFGGIGTYVRGAGETNADVGDRANDAIRITGAEVRAKVVGEGANLGMTQRGRIEYALAGGRCNSDAIDNSAGVNSSDVEVNIKIALAPAMRKGSLTRAARNKLLSQMTDEVAALVLANNYEQTLALSLARARGAADLAHLERFMQALEARGLLDRTVESLPSTGAVADRAARGEGLTRPELGVLLAYAKLALFDDLVSGPLPDEPYLEADLFSYFPEKMAKKFGEEIRAHPLRREIIATVLANDVINRGGPSFITRLQDLSGRTASDVVAAYVVVSEGFELPALFRQIDALDNRIDGIAQLELYQAVGRLIHAATLWQLRHGDAAAPLAERIAALRSARKTLQPHLAAKVPAQTVEFVEQRLREIAETGAPKELATRLAWLPIEELIPDIALLAEQATAELRIAARAYFCVTEKFRIGRINEAARAIQPADYYDGLALARAIETMNSARRGLARAALVAYPKDREPVTKWVEAGGERVARTREQLQALTEAGELTVSRLTVASGLMADLG
ncbi:NAD-glutamate dehydrogenase [Aminobacter sp. J44]|uniref:NAD-glutamate dehydrogenase n=1 Tax=Aminobacter sp. J44 TaxID=935262 RepID=UPI001199C114|nr:NAD-glutamate dehydrogenase [Aminobacter sp. J44]TWG50006.1 glutamate dehydrogenase [Aminobacter sp. J44]